jgi:hypothetical protein
MKTAREDEKDSYFASTSPRLVRRRCNKKPSPACRIPVMQVKISFCEGVREAIVAAYSTPHPPVTVPVPVIIPTSGPVPAPVSLTERSAGVQPFPLQARGEVAEWCGVRVNKRNVRVGGGVE